MIFMHSFQTGCRGRNVDIYFLLLGGWAGPKVLFRLDSFHKGELGRNKARITKTSRKGMGASMSRAMSVSQLAHSLSSSLPTRKLRSNRACASSIEAICWPGTHNLRSRSSSWSDWWMLATSRPMAPSQSVLAMKVSKRIHEARRMGAAIRSRVGMTAGWLTLRSLSLTRPVGSKYFFVGDR